MLTRGIFSPEVSCRTTWKSKDHIPMQMRFSIVGVRPRRKSGEQRWAVAWSKVTPQEMAAYTKHMARGCKKLLKDVVSPSLLLSALSEMAKAAAKKLLPGGWRRISGELPKAVDKLVKEGKFEEAARAFKEHVRKRGHEDPWSVLHWIEGRQHGIPPPWPEVRESLRCKPPGKGEEFPEIVPSIINGDWVIDPEEVLSALRTCDGKRKMDVWGICPWMIMKVGKEAHAVVAKAFEAIMKTGMLPKGFGEVVRIPVPKGDGRFRPIDMSPILSRVYEKVLLTRTAQLRKSTMVHPDPDVESGNQLGFVKGMGAELCIGRIAARAKEAFLSKELQEVRISRGLGQPNVVRKLAPRQLLLIMDFKEAYPSTFFSAIRKAINENVADPALRRAIMQVLMGRDGKGLTVKLRGFDGKVKDTEKQQCGIAAGKVFGPIVWRWVIAPMISELNTKAKEWGRDLKGVRSVEAAMIADDCYLTAIGFEEGEMRQLVEKALIFVEEWGVSRGLVLSEKKCHYTVFSRAGKENAIFDASKADEGKKSIDPERDLRLTAISPTTKRPLREICELRPRATLFGVDFDVKMHMVDHTNKVVEEMLRAASRILVVRHLLSAKNAVILGNGLCPPPVGIEFWSVLPFLKKEGERKSKVLKRIDAARGRVARVALGVAPDTQLGSVLAEIGWDDIYRTARVRLTRACTIIRAAKPEIKANICITSLSTFKELNTATPTRLNPLLPHLWGTAMTSVPRGSVRFHGLGDSDVTAESSVAQRQAFNTARIEALRVSRTGPTWEVFSDGSVKMGDKGRCAGWAVKATPYLTSVRGAFDMDGPAGDLACSFSAEAAGILAGVTELRKKCVDIPGATVGRLQNVQWFTDSLSMVMMLARGPADQKNPWGCLIWNELLACSPHVQWDFVFIFSHCGVAESERVDEMAAQAAERYAGAQPPHGVWETDFVRNLTQCIPVSTNSSIRDQLREPPAGSANPNLVESVPLNKFTLPYTKERLLMSARLGNLKHGLLGRIHGQPDQCKWCKEYVLGDHGRAIIHVFTCGPFRQANPHIPPWTTALFTDPGKGASAVEAFLSRWTDGHESDEELGGYLPSDRRALATAEEDDDTEEPEDEGPSRTAAGTHDIRSFFKPRS
jgi:ribonuclease HI